ncbi:helix-turn-helix domain-containing protein [Sporosarcina obsidiansis]|uniref:helix-turn-helix domain-containing protein n=1 Tax=Sporosarcina obsidiansis TaxID=2660748 RepID=UPI00129A42C9|nr:helix-turn-helix domain-containing protein [Sporosarcina obsidiansis]
MVFISLLLTMFQRLHGERSAQGVYHILRGKKSGQTLQDIENYQLKSFYALLPNLPIHDYQQVIEGMSADGFIQIEDRVVYVTAKGLKKIPNKPWRFNGWEYRGREREFFKRLALTVQTLSYLRVGQTMFTPIQKELHIQLFVKEYIRSQSISVNRLSEELRQELEWIMTEGQLSDEQCDIFSYRLTGQQLTAFTWEQLSETLKLPVMTIQLSYLESLHIVLDFIENGEKTPLLKSLAVGCRVETYLTHSAERTRKLFQQGYSIEQIASLRSLKLSTIEDHLVEMAANFNVFPYEEFITNEQIEKVWQTIDQLETKRLRLLKEHFVELSYFQLRLIMIHGK